MTLEHIAQKPLNMFMVLLWLYHTCLLAASKLLGRKPGRLWLDESLEETPEASFHTPAPRFHRRSLFVMLLHARQVALKLFLLYNAEPFYLHNFPVYFLSKDVSID